MIIKTKMMIIQIINNEINNDNKNIKDNNITNIKVMRMTIINNENEIYKQDNNIKIIIMRIEIINNDKIKI